MEMLSFCPEDFVSLSKTRAFITEDAPIFRTAKRNASTHVLCDARVCREAGVAMVSAASFVVFSKKSYRQEVRIIVRVKGIRVLLDPRQSRRLSEKKQEKSRFGHQSFGEAGSPSPSVRAC